MTENDWLMSTDGAELAEHLGAELTGRKAHLLMLACCRRHARYFVDDVVREAVAATAAHFTDPIAPDVPFDGPHLRELYRRVERVAAAHRAEPVRGVAFGVLVAVQPVAVMEALDESLQYLIYSCLHDIASGLPDDEAQGELAAQAALAREIFGNPFRPVTVKPEWRTDTVLALARQMYATEELSAMPILADALQDAGCDNTDVLNHCRDPNLLSVEPPAGSTGAPCCLHVRGCWVLDLILEKA
jgi:hypothetical protein